MMKNEWIDKEVKMIQTEMKESKKRQSRGDYLFPYLMIMLFILLILNFKISCHGEENPCCPYCNQEVTELVSGYNVRWLFPNTWICSNPTCGYENYEGIDYCGRCGTRRK